MKELIERLRTWKAPSFIPVEGHPMLEAADFIEQQAAENAKLDNEVDRLEAISHNQSIQLAHDSVTIECLNDKVTAQAAEIERLIEDASKQQSRGAEFIELQTAAKMAIITLEGGGILGSTTTIKALKEALREDLTCDKQKISAMEKQEPVAWQHEFIGDHKRLSYTPHIADVDGDHRNDAVKVTPLYAAPKVAQPLSELQINGMCADANRSHDIDLIDYTKAVKDAERAHNIGGQQP